MRVNVSSFLHDKNDNKMIKIGASPLTKFYSERDLKREAHSEPRNMSGTLY